MQKFKFDELISYFNRKVCEMDIGTKYKMELLGMVTALGYAHEKETEERKTGRWIPVTNGRGGHECDQCHNYAPAWQTGEERLTAYCPNCGADMREGEPNA